MGRRGRGRRQLDTEKLKEHSGEDSITARGLRTNPFTFIPQYKIFLIMNGAPIILGDRAFWDRVHHLPFNHRIADAELVLDFLGTKLMPELDGILARFVRGAVAWAKGGLNPPAKMRRAKEDLQNQNEEIFAEWYKTRVVKDENRNLSLATATEDFRRWAWGERHLSAHDLPGRRSLKAWLQTQAKLSEHKVDGARNVFLGIGLKPGGADEI